MPINVLIADDSEFIRKTISSILLENKEIKIIGEAENGMEAIEMAEKKHPDVIILDLIMPKMDGLDAFEEIMNEVPTPIVILSALSPQNMDVSVQALLLGAFDFIIKPGGLGSKHLTRFREELLAKVLLASQSRIGNIVEDENSLSKNLSFRQENVKKIFEFGQYLNKLRPIQENEESKTLEPIGKNMAFYPGVKEGSGVVKKKKLSKKSQKTSELSDSTLRKEKQIKRKAVNVVSEKRIHSPKILPIKKVNIPSKVIVVGASVGGPKTLTTILRGIPKELNCPILIIQHLNPLFVDSFAKTLNHKTKIKIKVAKNQEILRPGIGYISPGDQHMEIFVKDKKPCINLYVGEPVNFCLPSIDVLFFSAAKVYKNKTLGILLTGMGKDGVAGLEAIQRVGGKTIAESEETCMLYGMPKIAKEKGVANIILPNYKIKDYIEYYSAQL